MTINADSENLTLILNDFSQKKPSNINFLVSQVYSELRNIARSQLYGERKNHTLNPTALAHEAYLKLVDQTKAVYSNRQHFFALAASAMRRILIDYARARNAEKRGGRALYITLVEDDISRELTPEIILALDELLKQLAIRHRRQSQIIEYWFFGGMSHRDIAEILNVSLPTVRRDWRVARAWLNRELKDFAPTDNHGK